MQGTPSSKPQTPGEIEESFDADDALDPEIFSDVAPLEAADIASVEIPELLPSDGALVTVDSLQRYLADIRRFERLSPKEETDLAIRYQKEGDMSAARRLITGNLRLVVKVALDYRNSIMSLLDLIQEGNIGLLHALKKFDPARGVRFGTYATWWIKAYILRFILNNWSQVKFATSNARRKLFFNLNREKQRLEAQGFTVGTQLLAESLDVSEEDIRDIEPMISGGDMSLDQPLAEDSDQTAATRLISKEPLPEEVVSEDEFQQMLRQKLAAFAETLKPRERILLERRMLAEEPARLQALGTEFGVTREAVRLMEKKVIGMLRAYLQREMKDLRGFHVARMHQ
jgi:RNA polymerase sigma-32 factor